MTIALTRNELESLRSAITKRQVPMPLTQVAMQAIGKGGLFARLGPLAGLAEEPALAMIELALAVKDGPASGPPPSLVWTLPDGVPLLGGARPTTAALLGLLDSAQKRVLIAGYEFDHGAVIFQPLHKAMAERGVTARIFVDVAPAPSPKSNVDAYLALEAHAFWKRNWPFGAPFPDLYYWTEGVAHGSKRSLHTKCVVVDERAALVGSANFTKRGHKRNLEVGVRVDDPAVAGALATQLEQLVADGRMQKMPAAATKDSPPLATEDEGGDEVAVAGTLAPDLADELLVAAEARELFGRVVTSRLPVPLVGEDVEGEAGDVIGTAELCWEASRVAVLLPVQESGRRKLEAAGWTCFSSQLDGAGFERLAEFVKRGD